MYSFTHRHLDPLLDLLDEFHSDPEGAELLKKLHTKTLR